MSTFRTVQLSPRPAKKLLTAATIRARGYLIAGFSLVWVANIYMSIFGRLRLEIKRERVEIDETLKEGRPSSQEHGENN